MLTSEQQTHKPKQSKIRYTEYYDLQNTFDRLYADSLKGKTFQNLVGLMASEENIKLAYRTIKGNKGSGTPGVDKRTIKHLASMEEEKFVRLIQKQFSWYNPRPVRRVEIPKPNGKTRPLGIPTIVDRTQTPNIPSGFTPARPTMPLERTTVPSTGLIMTPFTVMCCGKSGNVPELP